MKKLAVVLAGLFLAAAVAAPGCKDRQSTDSQTSAAPPAGAASTSPATAPASQPTATGPAAASKPAWTIDPALPAKDLADYNKKMEELKKQFPFVPIKDWKGIKFVFATMPKHMQTYGYTHFTKNNDNHTTVTYKEVAGRIGTIMEVVADKDFTDTYNIIIKMDDNKQIYEGTGKWFGGLAPIAEIERANTLWKGKSLWLLVRTLSKYPEGEKYESFKVRRFSPVKVIAVEAGWREDNLIRFILETESGEKGFLDCSLSGTNDISKNDNNKNRWTFDGYFMAEDPRKLFSWDDKTWKAVEDRNISIGMSSEQVILCLNFEKPDETKHTTTDKGSEEQWIYKNKGILYFINGILSKIAE